jgi:hypothetical protein
LPGSLIRHNQEHFKTDGSKLKYYNTNVNEPKIFNIFGEGSTGRKKVSIFLANMLIIKQRFSKYVIK